MFEGMIVRPRCVNGFFKATIPSLGWRCRHRHRHIMNAHLCGWLKYRTIYPVQKPRDAKGEFMDQPDKLECWEPLEEDEQKRLIAGCPVFIGFRFCGGGHNCITAQEFKVYFAHAKVCPACAKDVRLHAPGVSLLDLIFLTQMRNN